MLDIGAARYSIFTLIIFTPGGLGTASEKSVGGESVPTILDKWDVQYSTLIFSLWSTWAGPKAGNIRQLGRFFFLIFVSLFSGLFELLPEYNR